MSDLNEAFENRQEVLDAIVSARALQEVAWERWFGVYDDATEEFETARIAYLKANVEVNRLIGIDNRFSVLAD
jgi:hypothetical protein